MFNLKNGGPTLLLLFFGDSASTKSILKKKNMALSHVFVSLQACCLAVGGWKSIDFLGLVVFATKIGTPKNIKV